MEYLVIYCLIYLATNEIINLETIFNLKMKKIEINKIYNQNCIDGMKLISKNKIDLVITDPPFAINFKAKKANYNRTASSVLTGYNEIKPEDYYDFTFLN